MARKAAAKPIALAMRIGSPRRISELREDDEERHHGEILEHEQADHDAAGERRGDVRGGEHLEDDDGAGERDHGAEPDRLRGLHPEEMTRPNQPKTALVRTIWMGPPIRATLRTGSRSRSDISSPREKSSRATPISASSSISWTWATVGPEVKGPTRTPAATYPTNKGQTEQARRDAAEQSGENDQDEIGGDAQALF